MWGELLFETCLLFGSLRSDRKLLFSQSLLYESFSGMRFGSVLLSDPKLLFQPSLLYESKCRMWGELLFDTCLLFESKCRMWGELLFETCLLFESLCESCVKPEPVVII